MTFPKIFIFPIMFFITAFASMDVRVIDMDKQESIDGDGRAIHYVNNITGNDENDGRTSSTAFSTIFRAISISKSSGGIVLANTGAPYHESIEFTRFLGTPSMPFIVEGNGAVLSGLRLIKADEWRHVRDDLYFTSVSIVYGNHFLVERMIRFRNKRNLEDLRPGEFHWQKIQGKEEGIFFRLDPGRIIDSYEFGVTELESGVKLYSSSYITFRNLTVEFFANDGFNGHGDCRGIRLQNVVARYNGDDGISNHDFGEWYVYGAHLHHNHTGIADIDESRTSYKHVLVEHNYVGVDLWGQFHNLVDCFIRDNTIQMNVSNNVNRALRNRAPVSGPDVPISTSGVYMSNCILTASTKHPSSMLHIFEKSLLTIRNSILSNARVGIEVDAGGGCHMTTSIIAGCDTAAVICSDHVFTGTNIFSPSAIVWKEIVYSKDQWEQFRASSGLDTLSRMEQVSFDLQSDGQIAIARREEAPAAGYKPLTIERRGIGPSEIFPMPEAWLRNQKPGKDIFWIRYY